MANEYKEDEVIRDMNERLAAHEGFQAEEEFDGREAAQDAAKASRDEVDRSDEQIREMNARLAAQEGFAPEVAFDEREAEHDA